MMLEAERQNSLFARKAYLDSLHSGAAALVGREDKAGELVRALVGGYKQGYVPPFIFVYGRTGSGKSTVARFVCDSLPVSFKFVDLRKARTVFGCAVLILSELAGDVKKGGQGTGEIIEGIAGAIEALVEKDRLFVLVLDEFDILLSDRRGRPSDFIYRLLVVQEKLKEKGRLMTMIAISNNVMAADELDDRVRSRIGSAPEVFFNAYSKQDILAILKDRAEKAFANQIDPAVVEYCADLSSSEHGDARRAIDLLRVAAEIAGLQGDNEIAKKHVDMAAEQLQKDRVAAALSRASYHLKVVCAGLVRITFLLQENEEPAWYPTSVLYKQYCKVLQPDVKPLSYRWASELLAELENLGLAVSRTRSEMKGYGKQYRLAAPPEMIGVSCFTKWWERLVKDKEAHLDVILMYEHRANDVDLPEEERLKWRSSAKHARNAWNNFVGLL